MPYNQQAMIELIPLYLNGSLNDHEKKEFEHALKNDLVLADEYALMASINTEFNHQDMPDSEALFTGINDQIDQLESSQTNPSIEIDKRNWLDNLLSGLMSPQIAWGFTCLAIVISLMIPNIQTPTEHIEHFQTLSSNESRQSTIDHHYNVIFSPTSSYHDVTQLLKSINANIVNGPNTMGLIVITATDSEQVLSTLKNSKKITFVEKKIQ